MKMFLGSGSRVFFSGSGCRCNGNSSAGVAGGGSGLELWLVLSGSAHVSNTKEWRKGGKDDDESITLRDVAFG